LRLPGASSSLFFLKSTWEKGGDNHRAIRLDQARDLFSLHRAEKEKALLFKEEKGKGFKKEVLLR